MFHHLSWCIASGPIIWGNVKQRLNYLTKPDSGMSTEHFQNVEVAGVFDPETRNF